MPAARSHENDPKRPPREGAAKPRRQADPVRADMALSDPSSPSFDEVDGTDESLKARDIASEGAHRAPPRG